MSMMKPPVATAPVYSSDAYLLLDGLALEVPVMAYSLDDHPRIAPLFRGTRHADIIEVSPWLVKPSRGGQLLAAPRTWQKHGIFLRSSAPMSALAEHLRSLISVRLPSRQLAYCRFHAPRWASRLLESMSPDELSAWCGPVTEWQVYTRGAWQVYQNRNPGPTRTAADEGWFQISQSQIARWQAEESENFIDRAATFFGCRKEHPEYPQQRARIIRLIRQAEGYGLSMEYQVLHYLELAWRFESELGHPSWVAHLSDQTQDADTRLRHAEQKLFGLIEGA